MRTTLHDSALDFYSHIVTLLTEKIKEQMPGVPLHNNRDVKGNENDAVYIVTTISLNPEPETLIRIKIGLCPESNHFANAFTIERHSLHLKNNHLLFATRIDWRYKVNRLTEWDKNPEEEISLYTQNDQPLNIEAVTEFCLTYYKHIAIE